jgi:hypothetical protein
VAYLVIPTWRDAGGTLTGPINWPVATQGEAETLVRRGLADARRLRGTDVSLAVMDDITSRIVAVVRPRRVVA